MESNNIYINEEKKRKQKTFQLNRYSNKDN